MSTKERTLRGKGALGIRVPIRLYAASAKLLGIKT